ncbi:hypothetical protein ALQ33_00212 [Pseudomonas syringae pv. philadelphi]|uniref:Peptidase M60 domain-containing protein n=2 Tax=Pseudomonas syringae group genomosp. 3 TaxID=251701 RepID=A0A3M3YB81_9PSED|nr:hypothetical protein ALQ33_00212 [Pseudomonas syringae pv. philadelphi]
MARTVQDLLTVTTPQIVIDLNYGMNAIEAPQSGLLSFIYHIPGKSVLISIKGSYSHVPSFILNETSNSMWRSQMDLLQRAPVVMLTSERAIIVVRYASARDHLSDPEKLMSYYDQVIGCQDVISGVTGGGETEWAIDPNKHFYVEADRLYMFATNGYMGFNGASALSDLLSSNTAVGWGPWHESGHQRQMSSMTWETGSGMTEVTVNLYSLATQEILEGRASRLDIYYPVIKEYLSRQYRDFNAIPDAFHKVVMLWQLRLTFGIPLYGQLHQRYRLMQNPPVQDGEKIQRFIVEASLISGRDLSTFFDRWGIYSTPETLRQIADLSPLEKPIWETDATTTFPLPLPVPEYFPERVHILSNLRAEFTGAVRFSIDEQWFWKFRYEITRNGVTVAWVDEGKCTHCRAFNDGRIYIDADASIMPGERWAVHVVFNGKQFKAESNHAYPSLLTSIEELFTDERCVELRAWVTQRSLDGMFSTATVYQPDGIHIRLLHRAQRLYLQSMIASVHIQEGLINVGFATLDFHNYNYELKGHSLTYATLKEGTPTDSFLIRAAWLRTGEVDPNETYSITVSLDHSSTPYTLYSGTLAQGKIVMPIQALFTDFTMTGLAPKTDQQTIDALYRTVNGDPVISIINRADYRSYLSTAQRLLLQKTLARVVREANSLSVYFAGDAFKTHTYKLYVNDEYSSEVTQGRPYYSSLSDGVWTSHVNLDSKDNCKVFCDYEGTTHTLYESNTADAVSFSEMQDPYITHCDPNAL